MDYSKTAKTLREARLTGTPVEQISSSFKNFSVEDAYRVQAQLMGMDIEEMGSLQGFKMGLTSHAKQKDVGVHEPIAGYLIPGTQIPHEGALRVTGKIHPRVEPEIAVRFASDLPTSKLDEKTIFRGIDRIAIGIEVLDSRFKNFKFQLADVIADNTSACAWAVGEKSWTGGWDELSRVSIVLKKNGNVVEKGTPAAVLDNPMHSIEMFARMGKRLGFYMKPGMWLLTGGITASVTVTAGDLIELESPWDTLRMRIE